MSSDQQLNDLFPSISPAPSALGPARWPGITADSAETTLKVLKENHVKFHTYFDPRGLHNHISHYILGLYGFGAHAESIESGYAHEAAYQMASIQPPEAITPQNFVEHLGDDKFYEAYRKYYADLIVKKGVTATLQEALDIGENFDASNNSNKQKEMLNRLVDGLLHPLIHVGYGVEFGLPGLVVEGLASAAVHKGENTSFIPAELWDNGPTKEGVHALTVLSRILNDSQFDEASKSSGGPPDFSKTIRDHGKDVYNHLKAWSFDVSKPGELERKIEEVIWANSVIYGVGGWTKDSFEANFFLMHFVTSSLFLHSLAAHLKPKSAEILLRAYFATCLVFWINRGRKPLDIEGFFSADTAYPIPENVTSKVRPNAVPSPKSPIAATPNPWFPLIQTTLALPDDHLIKLYRALAHFASIYGGRKAGYFAGTELKGAEKLDGTLFLRIAGLTEKRISASPRVNAPFAFIWDGVRIPAELEGNQA